MRRRNPDDELLLRRLRPVLEPEAGGSGKGRWWILRVYDGATEAGWFTFERFTHNGTVYVIAMEVEVAPAFRRRGVASWMYRWVGSRFKAKVSHSPEQTDDGKSFQRGRRPNPDDELLLRRLTVETDDDPRSMRGKVDHYLECRVFDGSEYVAIATFRVLRKYAEAVDVQVIAKYRRRGVASWLYRWIERKTGLIVKHSKDQTSDGRSFAKGRRRNPGDPKAIEAELVRAYGVSRYDDVMRGWVLADGRILDLGSHDPDEEKHDPNHHGERAESMLKASGFPYDTSVSEMRQLMRAARLIRVADGGRGAMLHLETLPTPAQVTACGRIAAAHRALDQDSLEIYWGPADRLAEVKPISAGKVRRILEALPPSARPNPARRRRNPPRDIDSPQAVGNECAVWAIAGATGRTVPEVRRAFLAVGADIWKKGGQGSGASMRQIRKVVAHLDWDKRIVGIGASRMFGGGPRAEFTEHQSSLFVRGRGKGEIGADEFDVPEGLKDDVTRTHPEAAIRASDDYVTVGQLIDQAKKDRLSLLAVTMNARRYRGSYQISAHILGYSPERGLYDTGVASRGAVKRFMAGEGKETITGLDWHAHGEDVPKRLRPVVIWIFFRADDGPRTSAP